MRSLNTLQARIIAAIAAIGVLTAASIGIGFWIFRDVGGKVDEVNTVRIKEIETATSVILSAIQLEETLSGMLTASNSEEIAQAGEGIGPLFASAHALIDGITPDLQEALHADLTEAEEILNALLLARTQEFYSRSRIDRRTRDMLAREIELSAQIDDQLATAHENLVRGGAAAIASTGEVLRILVEEDFNSLSIALTMRAEFNLLTGLLISLKQTDDPGVRSILTDLGTAGLDRLTQTFARFQETGQEADLTAQLSEAVDFFTRELAPGRAGRTSEAAEVLALRRDVDKSLAVLLDDLEFTLTYQAESANETNAQTIQHLLDQEVASMVALGELKGLIKTLVKELVDGSISPDDARLSMLEDHVAATVAQMLATDLGDRQDLTARMDALLTFANPNIGLLKDRRAVLAVERRVEALVAEASESVSRLSGDAAEAGQAAMDSITQAGQRLAENTNRAWTALSAVAILGIFVFLATRWMVRRAITEPMEKLCAQTLRLSEGDMTSDGSLMNNSTEIGQIAGALEVFRNNAIRVENLRKENAEQDTRAKEKQKEMLSQLSSEIGSVVEAGSRGDFSKRVEHSFDDPELAGLARDVNQLLDAVHKGVEETKTALTAIAHADLTHRMSEDFSGVFAELSTQANAASRQLGDLIGRIHAAITVSANRSRQVSDGARHIADQAESQAASIEETSATMDMMAQSLSASAEKLTDAERLSQLVAEKTGVGTRAANEAVDNVQKISASSEEITQINTVIEEISFQTNLLALNAAVEAARAGDAGKGFAVVAAEVRALAQRSAEAAQEIGNLVRQSAQNVELGVASVEATRAALHEIEDTTRPVMEALESVANNGREQSAGITQITKAMKEIDEVTHNNVRHAEGAASHATELLRQVDALTHLISSFEIPTDPGRVEGQDDEPAQDVA